MNPNGLPLYGLGTGPNVNMLDNILMAGGFPATEQPKPALTMPQYTYAQDIHHHAMNLVQPAQVVTSDANPVHVIVYQNDAQQQQPISYKMAQIGTTVVQQQQPQIVQQPAQRVQYIASTAAATAARQATATPAAAVAVATTTVSHVQRKKDIVAQAMQEQKIFEQQMPKAEAVVKQEPGVPPVTSTTVKAAPAGPDIKPVINQTKTPTKRQYNKSNVNVKKEPGTFNSSSSSSKGRVPLMVIDDDEDDGLTCRLCMASYWYKTEMYEHYKTVHSITDPAKYDKEEKIKKMKKLKEEQHRINMAKRQREERERRMNQKGRGMIKLTSPGARQSQAASARPSFQYRDGAFICDLCKESFSDGNDMVTHWKSHVKKQQVDSFSRGRGRGRGRGRAMIKREDSSDDEIGSGRPGRKRRRRHSSASSDDRPVGRGRGTGKAEKGKPRWTAYLLWSTRKRRDVVVDHPDWTFAQIAKWISEEWKQIDSEEKDELQKEAEEMNELGIRKLPRDDDAPDPEKDTTDEDSDFEEGYRRKQKVKVKRERQEGEDGGGDEVGLEGTSESDWEPEADIVPAAREKSRSGRQRKRPSFFQEFESQENNLDNILAEFEQTQAAEFGKPRKPKPPPKPESERKPRKRRSQVSAIEPVEVAPVEVETLRSGRKRKVRRVMNAFLDDEDEDDKLLRGASSDDDDFEPPPDEEVEKLEDEDDAIEEDEEMDEDASDDLEDSDDERLSRGMMALPLKKRGRPKKILTDYEIEEATRAAMYTRPSIEITKVPRVYSAEGMAISKDVALDLIMMAVEKVEGPDPARFVAKKSAPAPEREQLEKEESPKFQWVNESLDDEEANKDNVDNIDEPESDAINPLGSQPEDRNPLDDDDEPVAATNQETEVAKETLNEEDALLETVSAATATIPPPFVNECQDEEEIEANNKDAVESDNPLGDIETTEASDKVPESLNEPSVPQPPESLGSNMEPIQSHDSTIEPQQPPQSLSEEDLLTGPAHNLDDSQYKADYVDPNLEDIFN